MVVDPRPLTKTQMGDAEDGDGAEGPSRLAWGRDGGLRVESAKRRRERHAASRSGLPHDYKILRVLREGEALMGFTPAQRRDADRVFEKVFGWPNEVGPAAGLAVPARGPPPGRNERATIAYEKAQRKKAKLLKAQRKKVAEKGRKWAKARANA